MFTFAETPHGAALDTVISELIQFLDVTEESEKDYSTATDNLVKLMNLKNNALKLESEHSLEADKIRNETEKLVLETEKLVLEAEKFKFEQELKRSWVPSPDVILSVAGTLATAFLVLNFEKVGVVTTKAFAFIGKSLK